MSVIGHEVLFLKPGPDNPRNSEGAFLRLADGSIMYAYSRYHGNSWSDFGDAEIYAIFSRDEGETWGEGRTLIRKNLEDTNLMSVSLLRMANGDVGLFFLRKTGDFDCRLNFVRSSDEGNTWSEPICCVPEPGYYVTNNDRVIMLKSGRIIFPGNYHETLPCSDFKDPHKAFNPVSTGHFYVSDDDGKSFRKTGSFISLPFSRTNTGLQETGLLELAPNVLWAWSRTCHGFQFESFSTNGGETWGEVNPNQFFSGPDSPMCVKRLLDGRILAIFNPIPNYTGREKYISWGRTPLVCAVAGTSNGNTPLICATSGASSSNSAPEFGNLKAIEDDPRYGYCYTAIHPEQDYILLAYCCGFEGHQTLQGLKIKKIHIYELDEEQ
ncbi:MAG: exo-alpha-sialidase [Clostridiales bacterium]|nr:exo-alpha-sialidase [Clostridiales bacterium]